MKKFGIIGIAALFSVMAMVVFADAGKQKAGDYEGWNYNSVYQKSYLPLFNISAQGTVEAIEKLIPEEGMSEGIQLRLKSGTANVVVHLGPAWFVQMQEIQIQKGDAIEVIGSLTKHKGKQVIIAAQIKLESHEINLRNKEDGYPLWSQTQK